MLPHSPRVKVLMATLSRDHLFITQLMLKV